MAILPCDLILICICIATPRCVAAEKMPKTQNEARSARTERNETDYAVIRPTDVADDDNDDVSGDYAYPSAPVPNHNNSSAEYLELIPEPDDPLQP